MRSIRKQLVEGLNIDNECQYSCAPRTNQTNSPFELNFSMNWLSLLHPAQDAGPHWGEEAVCWITCFNILQKSTAYNSTDSVFSPFQTRLASCAGCSVVYQSYWWMREREMKRNTVLPHTASWKKGWRINPIDEREGWRGFLCHEERRRHRMKSWEGWGWPGRAPGRKADTERTWPVHTNIVCTWATALFHSNDNVHRRHWSACIDVI